MLQALSLYRYVCVCVLIGTENAYHANIRRYRQEGESSPTDSRGGPHHVCDVAFCSTWHFALRVDTGGSPTDSRGGPYRFKRWPPQIQEVAPTTCVVWHFALCGTLLCVGNGF